MSASPAEQEAVVGLTMQALAAGLTDDPAKGADFLADIGHWGAAAIFGACWAFAECICIDMDRADDDGSFALEVVHLETDQDALDEAPPEVVWCGRFITAHLNEDPETKLALFNAAEAEGFLPQAALGLLGAAHAVLRDRHQRMHGNN